MARRRNRFQFTGKSHSKKGMTVTFVSLALILLYVIFLALAYKSTGNLSLYYGAWGLMALFVSVLSIVFGVQSLGEEDSFPLFPRLGLFLAVLSTLVWGATYVIGLGLF